MTARSRLFALVICSLLAAPFSGVPAVHAQAGLSLAINDPDGSNDRVAAGRDYATEVLGDPWDMNEATDVNLVESSGVSGATFSSGVFSATAATNDPALFLLDPGIASSQRQGKTGKNFPIDTTTYHVVSIRMNVSVASSLQVFWFTGAQGGPFGSTSFIATTPGWHVYTFDLATVASWDDAPATGFRLDPTTASGSTFQIDWVRLTATGDASTDYLVSLTPEDPGSNAAVNLYLDDDTNFANGYVDEVATLLREDTTTTASLELAHYAPGNYFVTGRLSRDYASLVLEDPWDMANAGDVSLINGFSNGAVSGGVFSGTTNSIDPFIHLNVPLTGPDRIDSAVFRTLSFQMTLSTNTVFQIFWQTAEGTTRSTGFIAGNPGSNVYTVDLGAQANWTGPIRALRIDPAAASGVNVSIDWVSVNTGPGALAAEPVTVTSTSGGPLTINTPPIAHLLQPDAMGGLDYAAFLRNNPWNMAEASDVELTTGLAATFPQFLTDSTEPGPRGDYLKGRNPNGNPDPAVFFLFNNTTTPIDANRFKNLTFRMAIAGARNVGAGSVARIFWQRTPAGAPIQTSDDIVINEGVNSYTFDMTTIGTESGAPPDWSGLVKYFRIDPHEFSTQRDFYIDDVKVAADDESNGRFAITWRATDADDNAQISLFRDTNATGFDGTQIVAGLDEDTQNNTYIWDTRGVSNGTYFIYAVITDGLNTTRRYATGRLVVANSVAGDTTRPIGALDPGTPTTVTNASGIVNVQGWALDNVQVASVQLLVDGTPVGRPTTGIFRPDVRNANPSFPDCSEAGFQMSYNTAALGPGTHSLTVAVYDTAGNRRLLGGAAGGQDTVGVFVASTARFFLKNSNSGGAADLNFSFGPRPSTYIPIRGDWDGDGVDTIGLFNPATNGFFLKNSNSGGAADLTFTFGGMPSSAITPIAGDWDGDGVDSIGIYNATTGTFFLKNTNSGGVADFNFRFGPTNSSMRPVVGDWDGDGVDTIGLYNPSNGGFVLRFVNAPGVADLTFTFGAAGATPLAGDWNNDGVDTIGIYVPSTARFFLKNTNSGGSADTNFTFGGANSAPVTGDWNGATP